MDLNHRSENEVSDVLDKSGLEDTSAASRKPFHLVMKFSDDRRKKFHHILSWLAERGGLP